MRSISFAGLHRILHLIAAHPTGITPGELSLIIKKQKIYETQRGTPPARATLFHCRNTLLNLNAVLRTARRLVANTANAYVLVLLGQPPSQGAELDDTSRAAFAELVLQNPDCRRWFFDLFMAKRDSYTVQDFRSDGTSVIWRRSRNGNKTPSAVILEAMHRGPFKSLQSPSEINAVLYGLRYWARDELQLVDEFFRESRGSVMYPIVVQPKAGALGDVIDELTSLCRDDEEWTTLSVQDLLESIGEKRRRPIAHIFAAIRRLATLNSGQIVLIPTSRSFAALSAGFNQQRQELELKGYLRDSLGRYISHIRLHKTIRSSQHG
jgi:hypothetical protein